MYIKREVKCLVVYAKCQEAAELKGDKEAFAYHGRRLRQSLDDIDLWADMAEAAMAVLEHILDHEHDDQLDGRTYIREQGGLWDAFVAARERAKGVSSGST